MKSEVAVLDTLSPHHSVQFYEDRKYLFRVVSKYLNVGIAAGHAALVIARPEHRRGILDELELLGVDLALQQRMGGLTVRDAKETLGAFMNGASVNRESFRRELDQMIRSAVGGRSDRPVRAFGEMVDVLWSEGNPQAAIELEAQWNELSSRHTFSLLCGYSMGNFSSDAHGAQFRDVCLQHGHVLPTEQYAEAASDDQRLRQVSELQRRARVLEAEIEQRRQLEQALRLALENREAAEAAREALLAREQSARVEAEAANRLKDEFLAVLSHELRTPLNAILGWAQIISSPHSDQPLIRRGLEVIQRNAASQLHVVEDLLDVSRIVTGKMVVRADNVNFTEVVRAAVDTVRPAAIAKDVELRLHLDTDLPLVTGDPDRLQQVVWNVLANAVKFTPPKGFVDATLTQADGDVRLTVQDNGQGIAPEFLPHVFDRFRQADPGSTRVHGGLGLGLAVVRSLVEAHGGSVTAESGGAGLGATFRVSLPAQDDSSRPRPTPATQAPALSGVRVLIVDADPGSREIFDYMLTQLGALVVCVTTIGEAAHLLSSGRFDVVIGDIGMPGRNDFELIEMVRSHPHPAVRAMRALAVTSYKGSRFRASALEAGFDDYVTKPVEPRRLASLVSRSLEPK